MCLCPCACFSQADFQALLESTGMSRSNPYYIVEQGKIAQLMKQSKAQRLALFKEIAGTRTYDERRKESLKIMRDTDQKRHTIDTVIEVLQSKLKDLEAETEQFKKYEVDTRTQRARSSCPLPVLRSAPASSCSRIIFATVTAALLGRCSTPLVAVWSTASTSASARWRPQSSTRSIRSEVRGEEQSDGCTFAWRLDWSFAMD